MKLAFTASFFQFAVLIFCLSVAVTAVSQTDRGRFVEKAKLQPEIMDESQIEALLNQSAHYLNTKERSPLVLEKARVYAVKALNAVIYNRDFPGIAKAYYQLSKVAEEQHNYVAEKSYALKAIQFAKKTNNVALFAESTVMLWSVAVMTHQPYQQRIAFLQEAAGAFKAIGNYKREGDCYNEMGDAYLGIGNGSLAMASLHKCLELYDKAGVNDRNIVYSRLGDVYTHFGDYEQGIRYQLRAAKPDEIKGLRTTFTAMLYNRVGINYEYFRDYDRALKYYKEALEISVKYDDKRSIYILVFHVSHVMISQKKWDEALKFIMFYRKKYPEIDKDTFPGLECSIIKIYMLKHQYSKALPYSKIVLKKLDNNEIEDYAMTVYNTLIPLNLGIKNYKDAEHYIQLYDSVAKKTDSRFIASRVELWKYAIDSARGDNTAALDHFRKYVKGSQADFDAKKSFAINRLGVLYETEKKDRSISELKHKATQQQKKLLDEKFIRNVMIIGMMLFLMIIFLLFKGFRTKQKNNAILNFQRNEIDQKNKSLEIAITDKEWLLKEIHHRVKNNLHMVAGLLAGQKEFLKGEEAIKAIDESRLRVEAMSMIHQKLYQSDDLSMIDMKVYILELTSFLAESFHKQSLIRYVIDVHSILLPLSHSVPIGLILNEAITNSFKYAFPGDRNGSILIELKETMPMSYRLIVHDNGIGLPENFNAATSNSLGVHLMAGLSHEIAAQFAIFRDNGTKIELCFKIEKPDSDNVL